ncbi:ATP-dependent sacrificial sulfur transferase LarE [Acetomicrobium mobile]|uniref:ATP-dependent sacrificial sulfur transferase LarE n=1 Tax=Acetomicrobium mobile TaxID=97477 RepID=UPI0026F141DF|nr:ATP-dependent sacrificial sulfur transferase LarE [Acetomicrobium mobile]
MPKWTSLLDYIGRYRDIVVLLSGGLDSSFLTYACFKAKSNVVTVTFSSPLIPWKEVEDAALVAKDYGIKHFVIDSDDLSISEVRHNHPRRCYFCRKHRDSLVKNWVDGFATKGFVIMDGATKSDFSEYRPGLEAAKEDRVLHPLKEIGLKKEEIRKLAREFGLSFWDKPSSPCLATRFPYGMTLNEEELTRVARAEEYLISLGFRNVRVRSYLRGVAVVEVSPNDVEKAWAIKDDVRSALSKLGFSVVAVDLEGHKSGKMDCLLKEICP